MHVEGVSLERDGQQGGRHGEHDQRNEDPQVIEKNQVDHTGLGDVSLSGVGRGIGVELFTYTWELSLEQGKLKLEDMNSDSLSNQGIGTRIFLFIRENEG